jgi:hypothetical protein
MRVSFTELSSTIINTMSMEGAQAGGINKSHKQRYKIAQT